MVQELSIRIDDFERYVKNNFSYLINTYGFNLGSINKNIKEDMRDWTIEINYESKNMVVSIGWSPADAIIGVGLYKIRWGKIVLNSEITLRHLVGLIKHNIEVGLLPDPDGTSKLYIKNWKKRNEIIERDMEGVIKKYSELLKQYADDILKGDTSIFPKVQKYYKENIMKEYY